VRIRIAPILHENGAAALRPMVGRLLLLVVLAMFAVPTAPIQMAISGDHPVADSNTPSVNGALAKQRQLARAPLSQDDPDDLTAPITQANAWLAGPAFVIWSTSTRSILVANHHILPPLRGPPLV
jgi:hypothetical protein